ncbi:putative MRS4-protein of the mitochondrial carrier family [Tilletiopsis washingtonensis]|uniref:Putative MRS4-protein of the mitochondrial carrier family n=1 Tax=Tilletiopsis washingtonensis TaxID=58919 RepID=A0A316ZEB2_9BASI|nr:putative MRS4-protein of the mitochondrial carrier family [Tilletiopsis washingtonensis]PWN99364.1 putative MRS4-protein of the mitochondrial carrier family [Tilletiopsis washingtonensis]
MAAADVVAAPAASAEEEVDYEGLGEGYPLHINMIAGALAGISEHAVMFPVDVIRTRMQVLSATPAATYTGVAQALRQISSVEGAKTLWRGVASVILGAGPAHAVYFGTYEVVKEMTGGNRQGHQFASTAFAGASATIAADAFMNPFDVIKQRMQMHGSQHRSVVSCARSVYAREGLRAFYVSYPTTLAMTVPFTAVQFSVYEWAKKVINPEESYNPTSHAIAGGTAGAVAAAVTNPLDVAKTLLQTRGNSTDATIRNASGMLEAFKIIHSREGARGFLRGLSPRVLTFVPSNALCWLSYEGFRFFITQRQKGL